MTAPRRQVQPRVRAGGPRSRSGEAGGGDTRLNRDARARPVRREKKGLFARIALFFRQVVAEMRKVVWPTRNELITYTIVVLVFVVEFRRRSSWSSTSALPRSVRAVFG